MLHFSRAWREVPSGSLGLDDAALDRTESELGCRLPAALREFFGELGMLVEGYFRDGTNTLLPPGRCRVESGTLVVGEEYFGALWGVRVTDVELEDPLVRCIDPGGAEIDGLFPLTEFLVGLLFRATVANARVRIRVERSLGASDAADEIHEQLLRHFRPWDRGSGERDCGFLSHLEGEEIIAALSEDDLRVGLKGPASLASLPEPLSNLLAELVAED